MTKGMVCAVIFGLALCCAAYAQDATRTQPAGQEPGMAQGGWHGQHHGWGQGMMGPGHGIEGTVTETGADSYTIKTFAGDVYTVRFSANTRILEQPQMRMAPGEPPMREGGGMRGPLQLKASEIKTGDTIAAMGQVDTTAKTVGAVMVMRMDPERAKQLREMRESYGKTWFQGKVTAVNGVKVSVLGMFDNAERTFVADENTTFRKRREPITLADVAVGDMVRVEGAIKDGNFVATNVVVMVMPRGGMVNVPRTAEPQSEPAPQTPQ